MTNEPTGEMPKIPFENLDTIEKNNALKDFFGENFEKVSQSQEERREYDHASTFNSVNERLNEVLKTANVTSSMKELIAYNFQILMLCGSQKNLITLEWLTGKGAGIFSEDKNEAKLIEHNVYKMISRKILQVWLSRLNNEENSGKMDKFTMSTLGKTESMLDGWRQEFIEYYKDEP